MKHGFRNSYRFTLECYIQYIKFTSCLISVLCQDEGSWLNSAKYLALSKKHLIFVIQCIKPKISNDKVEILFKKLKYRIKLKHSHYKSESNMVLDIV